MNELTTPFGKLKIYVNEKQYPFENIPLALISKSFRVDMRALICVKPPKDSPCRIAFCFDAPEEKKMECCVETGERLALASYTRGDFRLSLSTIGDLPDRKYRYLNNGLEVLFETTVGEEVFFCLAGKHINEGESGIDTWLAADVDSIVKNDIVSRR